MSEQAIVAARPETQAGFAAVLRQRPFVVLWLSESISLIGDRLLTVALAALIYEMTRSPAAVGLLLALKAGPALLLGSVAGTFADRWNRKWVMVGANLLQGMLVLLIPLTDSLPVVFGVYLAMSIINQFFIPARAAVIPDLVPPAALMAANAVFAASYVGAIAIGPAIGGMIAERSGLAMAFYVDSVTFLLPALAVAGLAIPRAGRPPGRQAVARDLREGFGYIRSNHKVLVALSMGMFAYLAIGVMSVMGVVLAEETFNAGPGGYGFLMSASGTGMLIGALGVTRLRERVDRSRLMAAGVVGVGLTLAALSAVQNYHLALGMSAVLGLAMVAVHVTGQTVILEETPETLRGRVTGVFQALMGGASFLAMGLGGAMAEWLGATAVLVGAGLMVTAAGLGVWVMCDRMDEE
ncbi:MAG: MFS transporter [Anaerolineae bacterium]